MNVLSLVSARHLAGKETKLGQHAPLTQYAAAMRTVLSSEKLKLALIAPPSVSYAMSVHPPAYSAVTTRITSVVPGPNSLSFSVVVEEVIREVVVL